jgi:hypothetical protein
VALYSLTVSGQTQDGSTSTFIPGVTKFTTIRNFTDFGTMALEPNITPDDTAGNGVNPVDVYILITKRPPRSQKVWSAKQ